MTGSSAPGWVDRAKRPIRDVAAALGLQGSERNGYGPCPACGAERRSSKARGDRRMPILSTGQDRMGWFCLPCGEKGSSLDLVAWKLGGARYRDLDRDRRRTVRDWHVDRGWLEPLDRDRDRPRSTSPSVPPPQPPPTPTPEQAPERPPRAEVVRFWKSCSPVTADEPGELGAATREFLRQRGYFPLLHDIAREDLARLTPLPGTAPFPPWWKAGRARTWRLVVKAWDERGDLALVHGRAVVPPPELPGRDPMTKLWPKHPDPDRKYDCARVFFANRSAIAILRGMALPGPVEVVVVAEGLTDWLHLAADVAKREEYLSRKGDDYPRIAVFGGTSGSFPALAAVRWPDTVQHFISGVDPDGAGRRYARQIVEALAPRPVRAIHREAFAPRNRA